MKEWCIKQAFEMSISYDRQRLKGEKIFPIKKSPKSKDAKGKNKEFVKEMSSSPVQLAWRDFLRD